ncbi:HCP-like protein [Anaeromyces robustus]|uniref:HCP-like protein n=1 Tax=Anaeromyces robustus TaxID=1754192 RepID=A0A1Y1WY82_9FUNG|nr:HCP-like protein [Anaeromyces robustus]|eukprot:ORX78064.1 HCP-like protein [Anaeromyces robustus]
MASLDVEKVKYINGTFQIDGKIIPKKKFVKEVAKYLKTTSEIYGIAQAQAGVAWCYKKGILHVIQDYKDELREKDIGHSNSMHSNSSLSSLNSITTMTEENNIIPINERRRNSSHSISAISNSTSSSTNTMTNPVNLNTIDEDNNYDNVDESEPYLLDQSQHSDDIEEIRRLYNLSLLVDDDLTNNSAMNNVNETRSIHDTNNIILSPPIVPSHGNLEIDYSSYSNRSHESLDHEDIEPLVEEIEKDKEKEKEEEEEEEEEEIKNNEEENKVKIPNPITPESISPESSAPSSPSTPPRTISLNQNIQLNQSNNSNNNNIPVLASTHYTPQESSIIQTSLNTDQLFMSTSNTDERAVIINAGNIESILNNINQSLDSLNNNNSVQRDITVDEHHNTIITHATATPVLTEITTSENSSINEYRSQIRKILIFASKLNIPDHPIPGFKSIYSPIAGLNEEAAFSWYLKAAHNGNAVAQYRVGLYCSKGIKVAIPHGHDTFHIFNLLLPNEQESAVWFHRSALQGYSKAQNRYGVCLEDGIGVPINEKEAFQWYMKAGKQGHGSAMNHLGWCYQKGIGVEADQKEAAFWYRNSAYHGFSKGQYNLAWCYEMGNGLPMDYKMATFWYECGAERGHAASQYNVGFSYEEGGIWGVERDGKKAVYWYRLAAEQDDLNAQNSLGRCYMDGTGVEKDYKEGLKWFLSAAEQGHANAQNNLGWWIHSKSQSFLWFLRAALQGLSCAQNNLAWCYQEGYGVEPDQKQAISWFQSAVNQNNLYSKTHLAWCYQNAIGVPQNDKQALEWYKDANEQNHIPARRILGWCYWYGVCVPKADRKKAIELFEGLTDPVLNLSEEEKDLLMSMDISFEDVSKKNKNDDDDDDDWWFGKEAEERTLSSTFYTQGLFLKHGIRSEKNYEQAFRYFMVAAKKNYELAQFEVAMCYYDGIGIKPNPEEAEKWLKLAAKNRLKAASSFIRKQRF